MEATLRQRWRVRAVVAEHPDLRPAVAANGNRASTQRLRPSGSPIRTGPADRGGRNPPCPRRPRRGRRRPPSGRAAHRPPATALRTECQTVRAGPHLRPRLPDRRRQPPLLHRRPAQRKAAAVPEDVGGEVLFWVGEW